jgi:DNA repair exonuclease SbcCD ATPase subunit
VLGLAVSAIGSYLGYTADKMLYSVAAIGVLLTIVGILSLTSSKIKRITVKNDRAIADFVKSVLGEGYVYSDKISAISLIEDELDKHYRAEEKRSGIVNETEALLRDIQTDERHIREFVERYPVNEYLTLKDSAGEIRRRFVRYSILRESESDNETKRDLKRARIASLGESANRFLALFPTKSDNPLEEIRNNLAEYEVLHATLTRRKSDCERFARMHSITPESDAITDVEQLQSTVEDDIRQVDEELLSIERKKSDLKIRYNELLRDSDKLDELEGKLIEDNETIARYLDNLSIIKKTAAMLNTAKNNMTARYLDPMRKSFAKYITLMDNEEGDYTMDTTFTVMKTDLGRSRQAEAYSRGTRDLHALAVRLALIDSLYEGEKPPVILDDPFTSFDDRRIDRAITVIKKLSADAQIIYFTCSKSRRAK